MYREVTMVEVKEVLRLWREGVPTKRLAAQLGLDPKTVRRYLRAAAAAGLRADGREVSDDEVREVLLALQPVGGRPRGDGWAHCAAQREAIRRWLADGLRLTKIRKLLVRQGVAIAYADAVSLRGPRAAVWPDRHDDPGARWRAGQELQVDTGWVGWLTLPAPGSGAGFAPGSSPPCARAIASSIRPSRRPPRARSRRAKRPGTSSAASPRNRKLAITRLMISSP